MRATVLSVDARNQWSILDRSCPTGWTMLCAKINRNVSQKLETGCNGKRGVRNRLRFSRKRGEVVRSYAMVQPADRVPFVIDDFLR
jgi:hypothetical protein